MYKSEPAPKMGPQLKNKAETIKTEEVNTTNLGNTAGSLNKSFPRHFNRTECNVKN